MNRTLTVMWWLAALASPSALAADLTVAQIVEKNVGARGGLAAWRAVDSLSLAGEMDAGSRQDVKLPFVLSMKRPHRTRLELTFEGQTAVQVYDGKQGWKVRPFLNRNEVEPFTEAEQKSASAAAELDGPLIDYAAKGSRVELAGMEAVEGKPAYKLRLTEKNGAQRNLWIDAASFLEVKIDGDPRRLDGRMRNVTVFYRDYRTANGLTLPYAFETAVEGVKQTHRITVKTVSVNKPLDDALFAKPQLTAASGVVR